MIISTKGRYALRVMIDLAEHPAEGFVPLQDISDRLKISKEYLNSILKVLVQHNQLESLRGKGGGYKLTASPDQYRVGTILRLVEGGLSPVSCIQGASPCPDAANCCAHGLWGDLNKLINDFLDDVYLSDFMPGGRYAFVPADKR